MRYILFSALLSIFPVVGCSGDNNNIDANHGEQTITPEKSKITINPLEEVANKLYKVEVKNSYVGAMRDEAGALGEIARDLEKIIPEPMGKLTSKTMSLLEDLAKLIYSDLSLENRNNILNEVSTDIAKLQAEINQAIEEMPESEISNLSLLNRLNNMVEDAKSDAEELGKIEIYSVQNCEEIIKNSAEVSRRNEIIANNNNLLAQRKEELLHQREELLLKLDVAKAKILLQELIKNIS